MNEGNVSENDLSENNVSQNNGLKFLWDIGDEKLRP
ncbi:MAG: hypothetical protein ACI8Z1_001694 [Candidatus Azotimanducaceae bacterium]|jgi:hypothetical protein